MYLKIPNEPYSSSWRQPSILMYFSAVTVSQHDGFHTMGQKNLLLWALKLFSLPAVPRFFTWSEPSVQSRQNAAELSCQICAESLHININSKKSVWLKIGKAARKNNKIDVKFKIIWFRRHCPKHLPGCSSEHSVIVVLIVDTKTRKLWSDVRVSKWQCFDL